MKKRLRSSLYVQLTQSSEIYDIFCRPRGDFSCRYGQEQEYLHVFPRGPTRGPHHSIIIPLGWTLILLATVRPASKDNQYNRKYNGQGLHPFL